MITRPLELSARLRPPPKSFDFIFLVNGGLIALFFVLFGSRFVLSPGLRVNGREFRLASSPTALAGAIPTSVVISVTNGEQIFVEGEGGMVRSTAQLREWLTAQGKKQPGAALLIQADASVSQKVVIEIVDLATQAGLGPVIVALQSPAATRDSDSISP